MENYTKAVNNPNKGQHSNEKIGWRKGTYGRKMLHTIPFRQKVPYYAMLLQLPDHALQRKFLLSSFLMTFRFFYLCLLLMVFLTNPGLKGFTQAENKILFSDIQTRDFEGISFPETCTDSLDMIRQLNKLLDQLHFSGYLEADILAIGRDSAGYKVNLKSGSVYSWLELDSGNVPAGLLESLGYNPKFFQKKPVHYLALAKLLQKIADHYASHGYPFARVRLAPWSSMDGQITASLQVKKNGLYRVDTILLESRMDISPYYIEQLLQIRKGQLYDHSKVLAIPDRIRNTGFMQLVEPPSIRFTNNRVSIHLKPQPRKASQFDVLIGLQPNSGSNGGMRITGNVTAEMLNRLGMGEFASFRYKSVQPEVQELNLEIRYPYPFRLPFGIHSRFSLFRNALDHRDLNFRTGVDYRILTNTSLDLFWEYESSRLLSIDTARLLSTRKLPESLDVELSGIGLAFQYEALNYRFNPRSGISSGIQATGGRKKVLPNAQVQDIRSEWVDFSNAYDSLSSSYQLSLIGNLQAYVPIGKIFTLKLANHSGIKLSESEVYQNEAFRIGGARLMRGFDEQSLFTDRYSVFTLEFRMLIGSQSYFSVFSDYGIIRKNRNQLLSTDTPYGIGTGLSLDTGAGVLLISAAVGSQMGNPLDFNSTKIHVGYGGVF